MVSDVTNAATNRRFFLRDESLTKSLVSACAHKRDAAQNLLFPRPQANCRIAQFVL
ncbi:hypothetical protein GLE_0074 [Lysobacter enzymogenes]|uniref:Uncharacterized protein n=1 Tax=Lysobacter enzymogenes TaxID=69 RepID=A0A0S2DA65_LYSEN|nr:hypothetical protein GLE_0074 [Lysobacter enzymogenes]